ncbi:MAG: glycoside hydrolase family 76 protein, partial [Mycobacteriaceae bacterium]
SGLVLDGLRPGVGLERSVYTYNQGTVLGLETELAHSGAGVHAERVHRLVGAVDEHLATEDVLHTHGGGDGGLFSGILARYLAVVVRTLPGTTAAADEARTTATRLVLSSARAAWVHREQTPAGPVFSADWAGAAHGPEGDLSVQLGAWMLLEAAVAVCTGG